jgi:outer membrane receptor protein involved in Fe transport
MFYGKYAEAFKAGGFVMNPPLGGVPPDPFTFLPEQAKGFEFGFKGTLFDRRLQLNVAYFDTKFTNLQVNSFNGTTARFEVRNAAASRTQGVEIDGRFVVGQHINVGFNLGTNNARYTYFPNGQCGQIQAREWTAAGKPGTCVVDISGRRLGVPKLQFGLAPEATFPVGSFTTKVGLNGTWVAGVKSAANPGDPLANLPSRYRIDLRVAVTPPRGNWEIAAYVRDLTDQAAWIGGLQSAFFSTTTGTGNSDVYLYGVSGKTFDRGRRVGVQLSYFLGR